jgi:hypothetical protein
VAIGIAQRAPSTRLSPFAGADFSGEAGVDGVIERGADVGVVGDRPHHGHAAGVGGGDAAALIRVAA